jgi:hypothetical protein
MERLAHDPRPKQINLDRRNRAQRPRYHDQHQNFLKNLAARATDT